VRAIWLLDDVAAGDGGLAVLQVTAACIALYAASGTPL
jgi:hypothetical protein